MHRRPDILVLHLRPRRRRHRSSRDGRRRHADHCAVLPSPQTTDMVRSHGYLAGRRIGLRAHGRWCPHRLDQLAGVLWNQLAAWCCGCGYDRVGLY